MEVQSEVAVVAAVEDEALELLFGGPPGRALQPPAEVSDFTGMGLGDAFALSVDHQRIDRVLIPVLRGLRLGFCHGASP